MRKRGRHRAKTDPKDQFLKNRFEGLEIEATEEDIQHDEITEDNVTKNEKVRKRSKAATNTKLATISEDPKDEEVESNKINGNDQEEESQSRTETSVSEETMESSVDTDLEVQENLVNIVQFTQLQPSKLLSVELRIQNVTAQTLLDTGSDSNMIKRSVVEELSLKIHTNKKRTFRGLGTEEQQTIGRVFLPFSLYGVKVESTPFEVVEDHVIINPIILGRKFIALKKITIDPANNRISLPTSNSSKIDIYQDEENENKKIVYELLKVYCTETTVVQRKLTRVPVAYDYYDDKTMKSETKMLFEGKSANKKLESVDGVMDLKSEDKFVFMQRKDGENEDKCRIKKGEVVGYVSTMIDLEDEEDSQDDEWDVDKLKSNVEVGESMTQEQKDLIYKMLLKTKFALSSNDEDIGKAKVSPHKIVLTNNTPIWQKPRRFSDPINEEIERQCKQLEAMDIIEKSDSSWSSPVVPVRKLDGTLRLCIDYRKVNAVTMPEKFPMPNLYDSIYSAHNIKFFTKIDLVKGYYQIPIDEESRPITSFSTQHGQYQFKRLSFGLKNSGIQFQRNMQEILSDFHSKNVIIYIDDILIISESFEEQLETVEKVLATLMKNGIKIKVSKSEFFKEEVSFLGHLISKEGIKKCPSYIEKIQNFPKPENVNQLRRFLGLANFQRKFVDKFSVIAKPLSKLTNGPKRKPIIWNEEMTEAYDKIKEKLIEEVTLSFPDYSTGSEPLELYVDASGLGAGACLLQRQNGEYKTIAYSSIAFSATEQNYSTIERELLALRWGVKNFRTFLFGIHFIIYTDHKPLVYLHNMARDNARLTRTLNELEDYDFTIKYRPGAENEAADTLSRIIKASEDMEEKVKEEELPAGLRVTEKIDGGGDSMFKSLLIVLENLNDISDHCELPENHEELRSKLVVHLLNNHLKFKLNLDKQRIKHLRAMRYKGVLPCDELLMAACDMFNIEVHVHHGMKWPIIFKTNKVDNPIKVVHLQCLAGIHYNPVACKKNLKIPEKNKLVHVLKVVKEQSEISTEDTEEEAYEDAFKVMASTHRALCKCNHRIEEGSCTCIVSVGDAKFCAMLDTGAQVSLITEEVWNHLKENDDSLKFEELDQTLVGIGNQQNKIVGITELKLNILNTEMDNAVPFAIVKTESLPWCVLLGLNFLKSNNIILDFENSFIAHKGFGGVEVIFPMIKTDATDEEIPIFQGIIGIGKPQQDEVSEETSSDSEAECEKKIKFKIDENIVAIQEGDHAISSLKIKIEGGANNKIKEPYLKQFNRYASDLFIDSNVLFKTHKNESLVVLPFSVITDVAVKTHEQLSHIGSNKLLDLILKQFWHPALDNICKDICKSCVHCQFYKVHRQHLKPPTLKIETGYPFEILAIDVMLLPKTAKGNIAVVVAIDHHTKWIAAVPIKNKTAATVTNVLKNSILPNLPRVPDKILSDNGPEFRSATFNNFLNEYSISHIYSTPYKPSSNGCVERSNRTIIQLLKGLIGNNGNSWDEHLTRALVTYNTTVHSEIKSSPSEFLLQQSHECSQSLAISKETMKTWKVGNPKFLPFVVGQKVLKRIQRSGNLVNDKLKPRYEGPFEIATVRPNDVTYEVKRIGDKDASVIKVHYDQLKCFQEVPEYLKKFIEFPNISVKKIESNPQNIPMSNFQSFDISDSTPSETEPTEDEKETVSEKVLIKSKLSSKKSTQVSKNSVENITWNSLDEFLRRFRKDVSLANKNKPVELASLRCSEPIDYLNVKNPISIKTSTPLVNPAPDYMHDQPVSSIHLRLLNTTNTFDSIDKMILKAPIPSRETQNEPTIFNNLHKSISEPALDNDDENQYKTFINMMEEAWSMSNHMIDLEISKIEEVLSESKSKSETSDSNKDESFIGFGEGTSEGQIGSARLNFLRSLKTHSQEYKNLAVEFKSASDNRLKAVWNKKVGTSILRLCPPISFSDTESSNMKKTPVRSTRTPTLRLHTMRTRSQGKALDLPNVQTKTIEYKNKRSDLSEEDSEERNKE